MKPGGKQSETGQQSQIKGFAPEIQFVIALLSSRASKTKMLPSKDASHKVVMPAYEATVPLSFLGGSAFLP